MIINYIQARDVCQLIGNANDFEFIRNHFSVYNEVSKYVKHYKLQSRLYAITPTGMFRKGLLSQIIKFANENNINIDVPDILQTYLTPSEHINLTCFENYNYYNFQYDCLQNLLSKQHGLCVVGTGGGKTLITAGLIESFYQNKYKNLKCLMIVDSISMVEQTINRFKQYGLSCKFDKWDKNIAKLSNNCTIINTQLITKKSKNIDNAKILLKLFENCDLLIFDEVHHVKRGNQIAKFVEKLKCKHKFGFTGTLPPDLFDKWLIMGIFGDIVYEKSSFDLRDKNYLTKTDVKIFNIQYQHPPKFNFTIEEDDQGNEILKDPTEAYDKEYEWLYNNEFRNIFIKRICKNFNNNILILVNSLKHQDILYEYLKNIDNKEVYIIRGEIESKDRQKVFEIMETKNNIICIAMSTIFSTGIDISNIHMVMFVMGGKSFIRVVQSIGRGIRTHKNKDRLLVVDIADNLKYGIKHLEQRLQIYAQERFPYKIYNVKENVI